MNRYLGYIKQLTRSFGLELGYYNVYSSNSLQLKRLLSHNEIGTVLDIGANTGQYAMDLRANGFGGNIISFEPLGDAYMQLQKNSLEDRRWVLAERMALGNMDGEIEINVSANSVSSSVMPIKESHTAAAPESVYVKKEVVPIRQLDSISSGLDLEGNVFVKIDVQGFELNVLKGAAKLLTKAKGIQLELSLVELYEGQPLMSEMIRYLEGAGFELHAVFQGFIDERTGHTLQVDGVFFRKPI